jgi:hypothetical protein
MRKPETTEAHLFCQACKGARRHRYLETRDEGTGLQFWFRCCACLALRLWGLESTGGVKHP